MIHWPFATKRANAKLDSAKEHVTIKFDDVEVIFELGVWQNLNRQVESSLRVECYCDPRLGLFCANCVHEIVRNATSRVS